jgi:tight adherence protein B
MGKELRRVVTEARLGRELEDPSMRWPSAWSSPDFAWAVMAIRIQREVGGNLAELLMTVADTMVQRDRLRRDVNSLTAEGRMSAIILACCPSVWASSCGPRTPSTCLPSGTPAWARPCSGVATVSAIVGFIWMKKTITIEI